MADFNSFEAEWLGRIIDYDHVYGYQCVDLILQYIYECYGIPSGVSGNAIDYWTNPSAPLLTKFSRVGGSDVAKGDIVVFNGLPGNPDGHIGISTGNINATGVEILEQNGQDGNGSGQGGDVIRTRYVDRSRVAGLLRPMTLSVPVAPPVPVAPVAPPYTVQDITPKQVKTNKDPTTKWGMNYDNLPAMEANPVATVPINTIMTVVSEVHHNTGGTYYRTDVNDPDGYNVVDCDDYVPPLLPAPPAAPLPIPTSTDPYQLIKAIPGYNTSNDAANNTSPITTLEIGTYYIFNRRYSTVKTDEVIALNVTRTPGVAGAWINPNDNLPNPPPEPVIAPPAPTPSTGWEGPRSAPAEAEPTPVPVTVTPNPNAWKLTYKPLNTDRSPVLYVSINPNVIKIYDLDSKLSSIELKPYTELHIVGTFVKDGVTYARANKVAAQGLWYGIPITILDTYDALYAVAPRKQVKFSDYAHLVAAKISKLIHDIKP